MEWLNKITLRLRFHRTLTAALSETAPLICQAFGADSMAIWFLEKDREKLRLEFAYRLPEEFVRYFKKPTHYPLKGQGIIGTVFQEQKPVIASDIPKQENVPEQWKDFFKRNILTFQTLSSHPLFAENGELVAILNLYFGSKRTFSEQESLALRVISNNIGAVVEAQDAYAYLEENRNTLKTERDQLARLYRAVQTIGIQKEAGLQQVVMNLAATVGNALGAKGIAIWKADENKTHLRVFTHSGISARYAHYFDTHPYPIDKKQRAILVRAFLERNLEFTQNLWEGSEIVKTISPDVQEMLHSENVISVASAPLIIENETFGVLNFYFTEIHTYGASEQYILKLAANVMAFVIGNIQYREKLTLSKQELQKALRISEEARRTTEREQAKTQAIIEKFSDGLIAINNDGIVEIVNKEAQVLLEVDGKALLGKHICRLEGNANLKALVGAISNVQEEIFRKEVSFTKQRVGEITKISLGTGKNGIGFLLVIHDITREKRVERLKTEFVSVAAHQLRTPTSAVKWALYLLLSGDTGRLTKEQKHLVERTYATNERMIILINDLLDVSRIEEGRLVYKNSLVNIAELTRKQWKLYEKQAKQKGIGFTYQKPSKKIPKIRIDEEKISLVLQNLLENALSYTPKKGTTKISVSSDKNEVLITVADTGIGIPEEAKGEIFQKFFRAPNAVKLDTTGSGLGLFIAKNIVEAHKGKIWFESQKNKGTTFFVALPIE